MRHSALQGSPLASHHITAANQRHRETSIAQHSTMSNLRKIKRGEQVTGKGKEMREHETERVQIKE